LDFIFSLQGLLGIGAMLGIAYLLSENRKLIRWELVGWGFGLQIILALFILKTPWGISLFKSLNSVVMAILKSTDAGATFVFGNLAKTSVPVISTAKGSVPTGMVADVGFLFAFRVLPTIIFFSALMAVLYHAGIMGKVVRAIAWVMSKTMKTSGPESLSCAANIFVGQTEAPLVVRPFVEKMTQSELTAIMAGGFATIAGGVLAAYVGILGESIPNIAGHLIAASIMSAPAALMMAKILVPEKDKVETLDPSKISIEKVDRNLIDAATRGAGDGLRLALNVGAMLIAFLALISLLNLLLGYMGGIVGFTDLSINWIFGKIFSPFAFLLGVPWKDSAQMGDLIGTKLVLNEFVAYLNLNSSTMGEKGNIIATYALCGFANFGSIGIQIGGISALAPSRRADLAGVAIKALIAGAFASFTTACIAGILI
jgi:concentrative nucleoside transporter, CNT family